MTSAPAAALVLPVRASSLLPVRASLRVPLLLTLALALAMPLAAGATEPSSGQHSDPVAQLDKLLGLKDVGNAAATAPEPAAPSGPGASLGGRVGVVNGMVVFIFHPKMLDYVRLEHNFLRPTPEAKDAAQRKEILTEAWRKSSSAYNGSSMVAMRKKILADIQVFGARRVQAYEGFRRDQDAMIREARGKEAKDPANGEKVEIELAGKLKTREQDYWDKVATIAREEEQVRAQVEGINDSIVGMTLLTRQELEKHVSGMFDDIREGIAKAQETYGLAVVFNEGYLEKKPVQPKENVHFDPYPINLFTFANLYREFLDAPAEPSGKDRVVRWLSANPVKENFGLARYYQDRAELGQYFWNSSMNRLVWTGARDVTGFVLGFVLDKYRFPQDKKAEVLKFVESIRQQKF